MMQNTFCDLCNLQDHGHAVFIGISTWEEMEPEREKENNVLLIVSCLSQALSSVIL